VVIIERFEASVEHDLMPHPRLAHNKMALRIDRGRVHNPGVKRSLDYLANRDALAWQFKAQARGASFEKGRRLKFSARIVLSPKRSAADLDNLLKTIFDALQTAGVVPNDRQIRALGGVEVEERGLVSRVVVRVEAI
jgi:Holliday junction resolvase RusA-like endonuclease